MIRVGGSTEVEVKEEGPRRRCHACHQGGCGRGHRSGGGGGLLRAKAAVQKLKTDNPDVRAGVNIVLRALEAPIRQIAENSGVEGLDRGRQDHRQQVADVRLQRSDGRICRYSEQGIVDPVKVVRAALEDAASVAGLLITTEAMVAEAPKKESAPAMPGGGGMSGMGGMDY